MDARACLEMRLGFAYSPPVPVAVLRPEPGQLPPPLEEAANAMHDARSGDEAKAAAREFLVLSEEWVDPAKSEGDRG